MCSALQPQLVSNERNTIRLKEVTSHVVRYKLLVWLRVSNKPCNHCRLIGTETTATWWCTSRPLCGAFLQVQQSLELPCWWPGGKIYGNVLADDVFGHFVLDSLVTLFTTIVTFWDGALSTTDSILSRFSSNLLLRWDPWDDLHWHGMRQEGLTGAANSVGLGRCGIPCIDADVQDSGIGG
jgi:hypothetical protein